MDQKENDSVFLEIIHFLENHAKIHNSSTCEKCFISTFLARIFIFYMDQIPKSKMDERLIQVIENINAHGHKPQSHLPGIDAKTGKNIEGKIEINLSISIKNIVNPLLSMELIEELVKTWFYHEFDDLFDNNFINWFELEKLGIIPDKIEELFDYNYTSTLPKKYQEIEDIEPKKKDFSPDNKFDFPL